MGRKPQTHLMPIQFGREICGDVATAEAREWLVTNGCGGYASGTVAGILTRRYHGLLMAALKPPLDRTLLLAKLDETVTYDDKPYPLFANRWGTGVVEPPGNSYLESFHLDGTIPVWHFAIADARLEKRIWMQPGANTTYIFYHLPRASQPLTLSLKALVNYRECHHLAAANHRQMEISPVPTGVAIKAFPQAVPFYLFAPAADVELTHKWHYGFELAVEKWRGQDYQEDHLHAVTFRRILNPGDSLTIVATTDSLARGDGHSALTARQAYEQNLLQLCSQKSPKHQGSKVYQLAKKAPPWVKQLVLAADQFIVSRPLPDGREGKTIIAGYPWFSDWGRDTMIALPGLTLCTGRVDVARTILQTFARYVDGGMLPNTFGEAGESLFYNTVDATLWYFQAIRAYFEATGDQGLIAELWPVLVDIVNWHCQGTRHRIHMDPKDGLLYAGEAGVQLTWMDAKVGDWVVTPRIGKPVEVNALWYSALATMAELAEMMGESGQEYAKMAARAAAGFQRFWNAEANYCYDVIDGPNGDDPSLRPNQIFAVSLPHSPLPPPQQRSVVDACARQLFTTHGLRSLSPNHPQYQGQYKGNLLQRDGAYHQGTVWGWLFGPFVIAYWRAYGDLEGAQSFLEPISHHLHNHGLGTLSEIFDGDPPFTPRGCIAQAWTVAEVLRAAAFLKIKS